MTVRFTTYACYVCHRAANCTACLQMMVRNSNIEHKKPYLVMVYATATLPLLAILLHLQYGNSMLFDFLAQVSCDSMQGSSGEL